MWLAANTPTCALHHCWGKAKPALSILVGHRIIVQRQCSFSIYCQKFKFHVCYDWMGRLNSKSGLQQRQDHPLCSKCVKVGVNISRMMPKKAKTHPASQIRLHWSDGKHTHNFRLIEDREIKEYNNFCSKYIPLDHKLTTWLIYLSHLIKVQYPAVTKSMLPLYWRLKTSKASKIQMFNTKKPKVGFLLSLKHWCNMTKYCVSTSVASLFTVHSSEMYIFMISPKQGSATYGSWAKFSSVWNFYLALSRKKINL